jgi:hypothetical protein
MGGASSAPSRFSHGRAAPKRRERQKKPREKKDGQKKGAGDGALNCLPQLPCHAIGAARKK